MPMHDWTKVDAGIYHDFHHEWISEIKRSLNRMLSKDYYALAEQHAGGFAPDVLTLHKPDFDADQSGSTTLIRTRPKTSFQESAADFYARKRNSIAVRHVSGDRIVAIIEIVSPGNKDSAIRFSAFVRKAVEMLQAGIHLMMIDPFPPGPRDPRGLHAAIWKRVTQTRSCLPPKKPLALASYACGDELQAFVETLDVGEALKDMPLYLEPNEHLLLPLEPTYQRAWDNVPARWQRVIAGS